jgi:hypothetical protein
MTPKSTPNECKTCGHRYLWVRLPSLSVKRLQTQAWQQPIRVQECSDCIPFVPCKLLNNCGGIPLPPGHHQEKLLCQVSIDRLATKNTTKMWSRMLSRWRSKNAISKHMHACPGTHVRTPATCVHACSGNITRAYIGTDCYHNSQRSMHMHALFVKKSC